MNTLNLKLQNITDLPVFNRIYIRKESVNCRCKHTFNFWITLLMRLRIGWLILSSGIRPPTQQKYALAIILNCIWWLDSSSGDCGVPPSLPLLPSPVWPRVVISIRIPSMDQTDLLKNHLYLIGPCAPPTPKHLKKQPHENVKMNVHWMQFPNFSV